MTFGTEILKKKNVRDTDLVLQSAMNITYHTTHIYMTCSKYQLHTEVTHFRIWHQSWSFAFCLKVENTWSFEGFWWCYMRVGLTSALAIACHLRLIALQYSKNWSYFCFQAGIKERELNHMNPLQRAWYWVVETSCF